MPDFVIIARCSQIMLAQQQELGAQFTLNLRPVMPEGNLQVLQQVCPVKNAVVLLHVKEFNGEDVSRLLQFSPAENERRRMLLLRPPVYGRSQAGQCRGRDLPENAQQIK